MKKVFKAIKEWWLYTILKKVHTKTIFVFGKGINKENRIYFYQDTYNIKYKGNKEITRDRINRIFVKKQVYLNNMYKANGK